MRLFSQLFLWWTQWILHFIFEDQWEYPSGLRFDYLHRFLCPFFEFWHFLTWKLISVSCDMNCSIFIDYKLCIFVAHPFTLNHCSLCLIDSLFFIYSRWSDKVVLSYPKRFIKVKIWILIFNIYDKITINIILQIISAYYSLSRFDFCYNHCY